MVISLRMTDLPRLSSAFSFWSGEPDAVRVRLASSLSGVALDGSTPVSDLLPVHLPSSPLVSSTLSPLTVTVAFSLKGTL